ncbi:uncharacterized protein LOC135375547 [Ornithodoros turicata]|uniref:uncharacterized protein LOC135375547 n=1 Tax=Ornithodoros turicata TaxID=34597 RepID=UPI003138ACC7
MPLINWSEASPGELTGFTADFLREELVRRQLDTSGSKEDLMNRLLTNIAQTSAASQSMQDAQQTLPDSSAPTSAVPGLSVPVQVTTLPDLSAAVPVFDETKGILARAWIEDLERIRSLASWSDATLRLIAIGKLRGTPKNWHFATGDAHSTWSTWKQAFLRQFDVDLSLIQWQTKVVTVVQLKDQTLCNYAFAKLRFIKRCPLQLSDVQQIEYLLQGLKGQSVATAIAAQRPSTVEEFLSICTDLDKTFVHMQSMHTKDPVVPLPTPIPRDPHQPPPPASQPQSLASRNRATPRTAAEKEERYQAITNKYGAPAYRLGQDLTDAACYKCKGKESTTESLISCNVIQAQVEDVGSVVAFPDSGSKLSITSEPLVSHLQLSPWTRAPLVVVGGEKVYPSGQIVLQISIQAVSAPVHWAVLPRNAVPLILGEDWLATAHMELHVKPPFATELYHRPTGFTITCVEHFLPLFSHAVFVHNSALAQAQAAFQQGGLQTKPLLHQEFPAWAVFESLPDQPVPTEMETTSQSALHVSTTLFDQHSPQQPCMPDKPRVGVQLSSVEAQQVEDVLFQHVNLFANDDQDLGLYTGVQHSITLLPDATPYKRQPYRYTAADRAFLEEQTRVLLDKGITAPASGPWAFPVVVVSHEQKKRLCVNYVPLNKQTVSDAQPLPRIDDIIDDISGARTFASLDLKFAYWQIALRPEDQIKTSFVTHKGTYQWTRMPFGLKNAPSTFQRAMNTIFSKLLTGHHKCGVRVYLDDVLVFATNFEEFLHILDQTLSLLQQAGFKVSLEKCTFAVESLKFLGFILSKDGKLPNPAKVEAIAKMPTPATTKAVLSWLQTPSFYRKFIKKLCPDSTALAGHDEKWCLRVVPRL